MNTEDLAPTNYIVITVPVNAAYISINDGTTDLSFDTLMKYRAHAARTVWDAPKNEITQIYVPRMVY